MPSHAVKIFNSVYQAQIGLVKGSESLQQHCRAGTSKNEPGLPDSHTWLCLFHFTLSTDTFVISYRLNMVLNVHEMRYIF